MKIKYLLIVFFYLNSIYSTNNFNWTVIGAGPAGIVTVGKLIDSGVESQKIAWIDPEFKVGAFGTYWKDVSSNTVIGLFEKFLESCNSFEYKNRNFIFDFEKLDKKDTCLLKYVAEPLSFITQNLMKKVQAFKDMAMEIKTNHNGWKIILKNNKEITTNNVVLAIGAEQKKLNYKNVKEIELKKALNPIELPQNINSDGTIAVFGSSHSAIIVMERLLKLNVKKIINFYEVPIKFAVNFDDWTLFNDTGLKGKAAIWARENLIGQTPKNLHRYLSTEENIEKYLPQCNKVIYAIGFKRNQINVEGLKPNFDYNPHYGIIAPGLFGIGIAFPQIKYDRFENPEYRIGLWKFLDYLNQILPIWLNYQNK